MQKRGQKGAIGVIVIILILIVLGMIGFIYMKSSSSSTQSTTLQKETSSIPTTDFAPSLPADQKAAILIRTSDSSEVRYLVPKNQVQTYIQSLPRGYAVVSPAP